MELNTSKMNCNNCIKLLIIILGLCIKYLNSENMTTMASNNTESKEKITEGTTIPTILSTNEIPTATCKVNSSCFLNSTTSNNLETTIVSTTIQPTTKKSDTENETATKKSKYESEQKSDRSVRNICVCDLKIDYCDINCCCDSDCSFEDKLPFGHCEEDFHHYDTRYCQYTKHIYINNTAHEYQVNQNGLFCVVPNNVPPSYLIQRKHALKSFQDAELEKVNKYSWPRYLPESIDNINYNYSYGKALIIVKNNQLHTFQYPKSYFVMNCLIKEDVKYLIDIKSSCSHSDISEDNSHLKIETYFANTSIISNPILLNTSYEGTSLQKCPASTCLPIIPKMCNKYFENCTQLDKNFTNLRPTCRISIAEKSLFCTNIVQKIKYNIYHNGTTGILKVDLFLHLTNVTYSLNENVDFSQTFEVTFTWWNHTLNYSSFLSGNPGYLVGKPILTADIISVNISSNNTNNNNSSSTNGTSNGSVLRLFRNPVDFTKNFMVLPHVNTDGVCVLNQREYTSLEFDYNMYLKCTIIEETMQNKNNSAKSLCVRMQETIFKYWSLKVTNNSLNNRFVGQFGNANMHRTGEWVKLMFKEDLNDILNRTWGKFDTKQKILICGNITTLLIIEIYYARVDFEDVINQNKILAATLEFGRFKNVTFSLIKDSPFNFSIKIATQVSFYDITTKKIRKIVDPPSLNIKLPHDFFYPFVKLNNTASKKTLCLYLFYVYFAFVSVF